MMVCLTIFILFIIISIYSMITASFLIGGETLEYVGIIMYDIIVIVLIDILIENMFKRV